ncbi:hypothetical protein BDW66DRAFT_126788 [Aspergillus desertorum]
MSSSTDEGMARPVCLPHSTVGFDAQSKQGALWLPHSAKSDSQPEIRNKSQGHIILKARSQPVGGKGKDSG